jgi:hypothetical protein
VKINGVAREESRNEVRRESERERGYELSDVRNV